jgi:hypothetical protein
MSWGDDVARAIDAGTLWRDERNELQAENARLKAALAWLDSKSVRVDEPGANTMLFWRTAGARSVLEYVEETMQATTEATQ